MKAICTFVLLFMSLGMAAQSNLVEFPYNPDADGNDIIGTADLMMLLSIFGDEFSEEDLYLNEDTTSAVTYLGEFDYPKCSYSCSQIPGHWGVMELEDMHLLEDEFSTLLTEVYDYNSQWSYWSGTYLKTWLKSPKPPTDFVFLRYHYSSNSSDSQFWESVETSSFWMEFRCYCSTRELPRVEYSYCYIHLDEVAEFDACVTEKVSNGWYPIGGISIVGAEGDNTRAQAFWRWAD